MCWSKKASPQIAFSLTVLLAQVREKAKHRARNPLGITSSSCSTVNSPAPGADPRFPLLNPHRNHLLSHSQRQLPSPGAALQQYLHHAKPQLELKLPPMPARQAAAAPNHYQAHSTVAPLCLLASRHPI